jgi:hypothetical protein
VSSTLVQSVTQNRCPPKDSKHTAGSTSQENVHRRYRCEQGSQSSCGWGWAELSWCKYFCSDSYVGSVFCSAVWHTAPVQPTPCVSTPFETRSRRGRWTKEVVIRNSEFSIFPRGKTKKRNHTLPRGCFEWLMDEVKKRPGAVPFLKQGPPPKSELWSREVVF